MHRLRLATAEASPIEPYVADVVQIQPTTDPIQIGETAEDFARLFDRHAVTIHRYGARRLGRTEADDLLSQTFLIAFERRHRYVGTPAGALPWLYGIATNLIHRRRRDEVRQYRAYARSEPAGFDQLSDPLATEVAARVDAASVSRVLTGVLAGLRQVERDVLLLYAWEDLSYAEIAEALNLPLGTVRSRLHRARRALRSALGPEFEENLS
ncbi:RNA polymerase sigma factor [Kribbella catacumbae]|uniref:RNA polymerase sigma factor n=1 Tax=Kribbella catacumbae TaxID=460086 RepID=UPI0003702AD2|nr:RNA polymerase sigma factor [Kribbella catacumbae]